MAKKKTKKKTKKNTAFADVLLADTPITPREVPFPELEDKVYLSAEDITWLNLRTAERNNRTLTEQVLKSSIKKLLQDHECLRLQMESIILKKRIAEFELSKVQERHSKSEGEAINKFNELCKKYGVSVGKLGYDPLTGEIDPTSFS